MSNSSDKTVEIGKKVLHALNNSGYVSVSDPHRVIIKTVLLDLRLIHGITPDTPPGDPDFEIPLIVHLVGKHCGYVTPSRPSPVAGRASSVDPLLPAPGVRRPAFDPVANQAYNLWTSLLFVARLVSALSAIVVVGWLFRTLIMGERGSWPVVGASALVLFCSWLAAFFFAVQAERQKGYPPYP